MPPEERDHVRVVVHDEDSRFHERSLLSSGLASGSQTVNVVPVPAELATRISLPFDAHEIPADREPESGALVRRASC